MINLDRWGKDLEKLITQANTYEQRELAKKEREHQEALRKVDADYQSQRMQEQQKALKAKTQIEEAALNKAAFMLHQDLQASYDALQNATVPPLLTPEEQRRISPVLAQIETHKDKPEMVGLISAFAQTQLHDQPQLLKAVEYALKGTQEVPHIASYIGFEKGKCFIIAPVDGEQNRELASDLEARILDVAGRNHIELQRTHILNREDQVESIAKDTLFFTPEQELANKFLWYTITLGDGDTNRAQALQTALIAKYNEIEAHHALPSFAALGITHSLVPLDGRVLTFFKAHTLKEINRPEYSVSGLREQGVTEVTYEQAATILNTTSNRGIPQYIANQKLVLAGEGKVTLDSLERLVQEQNANSPQLPTPRGPYTVKGYDFQARDVQGRKEEARQRVNQYGETLSVHELAHVLGGMGYSGARRVADAFPNTQTVDAAVKGGKETKIAKADVLAFIDTYEPKENIMRWYKKGSA